MFKDTLKAAGSYVRKDQIRPHFEVSDDGYEHCHLVVGWSRPTKCDSFHKTIKRWQAQVGSEKCSNACHVLPQGDKESAKLGPYQVMINYVTDPKKKKAWMRKVLPGLILLPLASLLMMALSGGSSPTSYFPTSIFA